MSSVKQAFRQLLKSPGYTALAVGALALGIGANTVLFSVVNTLFLRPLGYQRPEQLVRVWSSFTDRGLQRANVSWPRYSAWRAQQESFSEFAAQAFTNLTLTGRGDPENVQAARVTANFFPTLGMQPLLGRGFTAAEDQAGGANVVLLSHGLWQRRFGSNPNILGQSLVLDGAPYTVIGVLPSTISFPYAQNQLWLPRVFEPEGFPPDIIQRGTGYLTLLARLKPGVTRLQAEEQLHVVDRRYAAANPEKVDGKAGLHVFALQEDLVGRQRPMILTLLAAVGCVLLVACANVANLLLARFTARRKEIAIRTALGATRGRIIAQFLAESVLTSALAGLVGILLAVWGLDVLGRLGADSIPRVAEISLDVRVLGFAVALSLLTGFVLGIVPALQASRTDPNEALKDSSRGSSGGRSATSFRAALLVTEVALSLVLLVSAALLMDSFRRLQRVDSGFRSEGLITFPVGLPTTAYPDISRQSQFFQNALERIRALPGVTAVAATSTLPGTGDGFARSPATVEGRPVPPVSERAIILRSTLLPGFYSALDIPLRRGRDFTWRDKADTPKVVIINETFAKQFFPNEDPIGHRLITGIQSIPREIVGIVADTRSENISQPASAEMYYPATQVDGSFQSILVRTTRPAGSLRSELIGAIHALDAGLPVGDVQPYSEVMAQAVADRRLSMLLLGAFAVLALALAGMGIYSVIAYSVAQRTSEFGIRLALGADPGQVVALVMKEGLRLVLLGLAVGLGASLALTRLMQGLLFEVSATDPIVLGGVSLFLGGVAALACFVPARRATKVDPLTALRAE